VKLSHLSGTVFGVSSVLRTSATICPRSITPLASPTSIHRTSGVTPYDPVHLGQRLCMTLRISGIDSYYPLYLRPRLPDDPLYFRPLSSDPSCLRHHISDSPCLGHRIGIPCASGIEHDPLQLWLRLDDPSYFRPDVTTTIFPMIQMSKSTSTNDLYRTTTCYRLWREAPAPT